MDEIHEIRKRMSLETRGMSWKDKIERWNKNGEVALKQDGYEYVKTEDGHFILREIAR